MTGKSEAERELGTFYDKVLPPNQSAARRMTYAALPMLASRANVKYREGRYEALVDPKIWTRGAVCALSHGFGAQTPTMMRQLPGIFVVQRDRVLAEYRHRSDRLADHLPWAALIAPGVVLNKDGSFLRVLRFRGPDLESATEAELISACDYLDDPQENCTLHGRLRPDGRPAKPDLCSAWPDDGKGLHPGCLWYTPPARKRKSSQ